MRGWPLARRPPGPPLLGSGQRRSAPWASRPAPLAGRRWSPGRLAAAQLVHQHAGEASALAQREVLSPQPLYQALGLGILPRPVVVVEYHEPHPSLPIYDAGEVLQL